MSNAELSEPLRLKSSLRPPIWCRLDSYIFSEINYPFWMSMLVYNGIFSIRILSEVSVIGSGDVSIPFKLFMMLVLTKIPKILMLTSAISFLSGTLFAMRRMSLDSEIIAPQSLGVSFWRLNRPIFVYGILLGSFIFMLNNFADPALMRMGNEAYNKFISEEAFPNINEGINPLGKNSVMYVDHVVEGMLAGMMIVNRKEGEEEIYLARRASLYTNREVKLLDWYNLTLNDKKGITFMGGKSWSRQIPLPVNITGKTFRADQYEVMSTPILRHFLAQNSDVSPDIIYELYRRMYEPLLFVILAMFAVPLAARHSRLNSGSGIGLSLFMIGIYFWFSKIGRDMVGEGRISAELGLGLPMVIFFLVGLVLQVGKNLWWSQYWRKNQGRLAHFISSAFKSLAAKISQLIVKLIPQAREAASGKTHTLVFPSKLDLYTMRSFFSIFIMVQTSFVMLFAFVEYTQISGFIRKNSIQSDVVLAFFLNKLPTMIDETLFISLLVGILLLFTVMSKNQEIVAIRAGGGSMQRLCVPLVLCGVIISASSFYLENQFLPFTNRNAQTLRNKISNKSDSAYTRDMWLRTPEGDIINYTHFDTKNDHLFGVTRFRLEGDDLITSIERTTWPVLSAQGGAWIVEKPAHSWKVLLADGNAESATPTDIAVGTEISLDLDMADLRQRKRKAGEFSIKELQEYLRYLKNLGYEEGHYQTELYAKFAKPLIPFFMMLLAMPLGIQVGRRGTFYGVGIGFGAGLSFLGLFELFKEFGASGFINPMVAGWFVVVIFGFVALYRFINLE